MDKLHQKQENNKEIMELSHEPWEGFKKAFIVIFGISCFYLAMILFSSLPEVLH
ncbi:MAG: hypothetical protein GY857_09950 [Desulfobacula sp.]|nr:hypothetical protein [Desulfobacula sp.]